MFTRVSSEERFRMAVRNAERVYILREEQSPFEAAGNFEWKQGCWDPRTVGLSIDSTLTSARSVLRLTKEMKELRKNPVKHCRAAPRADNIHEWTAVINGPENTVYEGGTFFVQMFIPPTYPFNSPKVQFLTRIYHCNINRHGIINIDILRGHWSSSMTIARILQEIVALLCDCKPENALLENIAEQYVNNRKEFDATARVWTLRFAQ
ncbi:Ubiquitin-conjugating enzyme family protein [Acanthocheilonema viteae]